MPGTPITTSDEQDDVAFYLDDAGSAHDDGTPRGSRRHAVGWLLLIAAVAATVILGLGPAPYVIERPGPVYDALGEVQSDSGPVPLIEIPEHETYPADGRLDLLTVQVSGSHQNPISWVQLAVAWFDGTRAVLPLDAYYPDGETEQQATERSMLLMQNSQQQAIAAALGELGIDYDVTVSVAEVIASGPSDGVLQAGDELLTVDGRPVSDTESLRQALADAGAGAVAELGIRRAGSELAVDVTTGTAADGSPIIGIYAADAFVFPFEVDIQLQRVGGPSAGLMFALGIYDKLTPGALTGGEHIAGTGEIDARGEVGPIGGIRQKLYGALEAGASWFLAPVENCDEVTGHIPGGLSVYAVDDLDDALTAVQAIAGGGDRSSLPTCPGGAGG